MASRRGSVNGWCYQRVLALPAIDDIELEQERVTLVITEPAGGPGLRPELRAFYQQITWQNRVAFLIGSRDTYGPLIESGKRLKAIQHILAELKGDKTPDADPQMVRATALANWNGLVPEERWWLYTQTAAATGHGVSDRGRGWRKAVRYALTGNPVLGRAAGTLFAGLGIAESAEGYEESAAAIES